MLKIVLVIMLSLVVGIPASYAEIQVDETYYYDLGDTLTLNGKIIGYDSFLFKENGIEQEPIKINISNTQDKNQSFEIIIFPDCVNGSYPDCDYTFNNSLSLSREVGFTDSVYNVTASYGNEKTSYEFGINNHSIQTLKSMKLVYVEGDKIEVTLDKDSYKPGDTVNITAITNFGFKNILTVEVGQLDSPVFDPTRYGSTERRLDYNQYDSTFSFQYEIENRDKRLGHYFVTVFDTLDSSTLYFKVSESGLEIIPDEPTLTFENQYLRYGDILRYSGYMDYTFDIDYDLTQTTFDNSKNNSENKRLAGNNVLLTLDYESEDFKIIGNENYINMNEIGYFEGELLITRNMPSDQIITVTSETTSQDTSEQFVILGDDIYVTHYDENVYDCSEQVKIWNSYNDNYDHMMKKAMLSDGGKYILEREKANAYKSDKIDNFVFSEGCN